MREFTQRNILQEMIQRKLRKLTVWTYMQNELQWNDRIAVFVLWIKSIK